LGQSGYAGAEGRFERDLLLVLELYRLSEQGQVFRRAEVTDGTYGSSAYWSKRESRRTATLNGMGIRLHAGYVDGHVGAYDSREVVSMEVIVDRGGGEPYPAGVGPGVIFLPEDGVR